MSNVSWGRGKGREVEDGGGRGCSPLLKTAEPIWPKFFVGHLGTPGKVMNDQNFKNSPPKNLDFH